MVYAKAESGLIKSKKLLPSLFKKSSLRSRTYIIPTLFGFIFGCMAFVLLMMAVGYANNLIYFFVFFLISISLSSMLVTNQNIDRILVENLCGENLFANEENFLTLQIKNEGHSDSFFLCANTVENKKRPAKIELVPAGASKEMALEIFLKKRGHFSVSRIRLFSSFPFGLLRAWKYYSYPESFLVYPERKGSPQFPVLSGENDLSSSLGLFRDHRLYVSSDSPRRIDWRASAKHQKVLVKNFESQNQGSLYFDYKHTLHILDFEDRLSQLCLWIDLAEKGNRLYSLRIGHFYAELSQGPQHCKKCLQVLAAIQEEDAF